jgi:hypothetical protein
VDPTACFVTVLAAAVLPAQAGWYVTAGVGRATVADTAGLSIVDDAESERLRGRIDDSDTARTLTVGRTFFRFLALEAFHADLGEATNRVDEPDAEPLVATAEREGFGLAAAANLPLPGPFEIYARAGRWRWETDVTVRPSGQALEGSDDGFGGVYGAGLRWSPVPLIVVQAEFARFTDVGSSDADLLAVGAGLRF